ncbi:flagellar assembly protein FliW [Robertmurraya yapensis]|uniref:Flagellar assembly factor FliW n=1 Tax=Bacillus yapensis TaxID=2492960 RepID=A0A431WLB3_9BACI|nr:flagellar assembly protein FliW [Bacillus yapensis]RTR36372.1 flagellar assembly protein FliW [Bacillus yapensis]TKT05876.1 flagellar assembly protein FliW [Bacillus yapensis]
MKVHTRYHGDLEISDNEVIYFKNGIPGFPDETKYILIPLGENSPFSVLQSIELIELAFVVTDPFPFYKDYEFEVPDYMINQLDIKNKEEVRVYCIVTLGDSLDTSTVNLQAPLVLNSKNNNGKQFVLNTDKYHTKHVLKMNKKEMVQEG